jgi:hypothetical protein
MTFQSARKTLITKAGIIRYLILIIISNVISQNKKKVHMPFNVNS